MLVPGPLLDLEVPAGTTVLGLARAAQAQNTDATIDWVFLAKDREVRVNKRKFSNTSEIDATKGYVGSIVSTPLTAGQIVLIIKRLKGNDGSAGVLTCTINNKGYALETPDTIANVLKNVVGIDPATVATVEVNWEPARLEDLIGDEDVIDVTFIGDDVAPIIVDGQPFDSDDAGKLAAIDAIMEL